MDDLVRAAHRELDGEIHRLAATYQHTIGEAMLLYEHGILAAQANFEAKLKAAMDSMTEKLRGSL